MAAGKFLVGKPSGGVTTVTVTDGVDNTNLVLPESGTVATEAYVDSKTWKDVNYKSTPVTITSWGYVGTTITLNVASHDFVVGDYIKTKGLTSTTYPANGVYLVTSVTSTTIVFTHFTTPTGTAGISTATVKGFTTVNGLVLGNYDISKVQATNDYTYLPDGKILQFGSIAGNGTGNVTGTLPITFPKGALRVTGLLFSHGANTTISLQLVELTTSTINIASRNTSTGALQNIDLIHYSVIGY